MEAEVRVMWPEAKEAEEDHQPPKAGRGQLGFSNRATRGSEASRTRCCGTPERQDCERTSLL